MLCLYIRSFWFLCFSALEKQRNKQMLAGISFQFLTNEKDYRTEYHKVFGRSQQLIFPTHGGTRPLQSTRQHKEIKYTLK